MKVAISSTGNTLDSFIDQRFGRCSYFVIYDTVTQKSEFIINPNKLNEGGAGPASVQLVASHQVSKVISGEFGVKVKPILDSLKIQMIVVNQSDKTINDIISMLNQ